MCRKPCSQYKGQHKCAKLLVPSGLACSVPVLVCSECQSKATENPELLECPLCVKGYQTPEAAPDLVGQKRKLGIIQGGRDHVTGKKISGEADPAKGQEPSRRLFVGRLPLTATASAIRKAFLGCANAEITNLHWIIDHDTKAFYGSAFCEVKSLEDAKNVVALGGIEVVSSAKGSNKRRKTKQHHKRRRISRVVFAPPRKDESWPPSDYKESEYPPIGVCY